MLLLCDCYNTSADMLYGKGKRLHVKLKVTPKYRIQEYLCEFCSFVRTRGRGLQTGTKGKLPSPQTTSTPALS